MKDTSSTYERASLVLRLHLHFIDVSRGMERARCCPAHQSCVCSSDARRSSSRSDQGRCRHCDQSPKGHSRRSPKHRGSAEPSRKPTKQEEQDEGDDGHDEREIGGRDHRNQQNGGCSADRKRSGRRQGSLNRSGPGDLVDAKLIASVR